MHGFEYENQVTGGGAGMVLMQEDTSARISAAFQNLTLTAVFQERGTANFNPFLMTFS